MLLRDVIFAAVIFCLCPRGKAVTQNGVKQWPGQVYRTPGENITIHCQIHVEEEKVSRCLVQWYVTETDQTYANINEPLQFNGRYKIRDKNNFSSSLTLNSLEMNDTGMFYCTFYCKMKGTFRQHCGNGTRLFVNFRMDRENVTLRYPVFSTTVTDAKGQSRFYTLYLLLVLFVLVFKLVLFIFMASVAIYLNT